jgi:hypothetical protein
MQAEGARHSEMIATIAQLSSAARLDESRSGGAHPKNLPIWAKTWDRQRSRNRLIETQSA